MSMRYLTLFICLFLINQLNFAQFPPAAGIIGSTAIYADSSCFIAWAKNATIVRGFINISDTNFAIDNSNKATFGSSIDATSKADNIVVSLGDKGYAILEFEIPIADGPGFDFAIFENALNDNFLELAFVEVSSDGYNFFRFPSVSLTQFVTQTNSFGNTDPTKIHNLAGKYRQMFGTPFDIDELANNPLLNKQNITHIKIIDVGGSINPLLGSFDSLGNLINDPFPTPFSSSGFDLDAVGVINNINTNIIEKTNFNNYQIFPNPAIDLFFINGLTNSNFYIEIYNQQNQLVIQTQYCEQGIDISFLTQGVYFVRVIDTKTESKFLKLLKF